MRFNPDSQQRVCANARECVQADYPTLIDLCRRFGVGVDRAWLIPQLYELCEFCGAREKFSSGQLDALSRMIAMEYGYLKISELMLFFWQFKLGKYGRFYGAMDPLVVTCALRDFLKERDDIWAQIERSQQAEKEKLATAGAVTYQQWLEMKQLKAKQDGSAVNKNE